MIPDEPRPGDGGTGSLRDPDAIAEAVRPELEALEQLRLELRARTIGALRNIFVWSGGLVAVGLLAALAVGRGTPAPAVLIVAIAVAVIVGVAMLLVNVVRPRSKFKKAFKLRAVGSIARAMEPGMTYAPEGGIPQSLFTRSRLFDRPDRYRVEDGLSGRIGQTAVQISQVHAEDKRTTTDGKGNTRTYYVTIFQGLFLVADFHKHFRGTLRVLPDTAERLFGGLGKLLQDLRPFAAEDLVYLEDPEFEREFVVYGSDQIEARYVLSTAMLRRILELKREWNKDVRLSFRDSSVYLAISSTVDFFEPDIGRSALSRNEIHRFVRELSLCFDLVNDLNLNTRIWSKA